MSSTGAPEDPGSAEDQAYFRRLEEAFLNLRGKATLLSPEDWQLARAWRRQGIPIELVVATMEALFERQRERRSKRGISSLRYFRAAVEAAWDERMALLAGGGEGHRVEDPGPPAKERLGALAGAWPEDLAGASGLRERIVALAGPLDEIETALTALETEALDGLWNELAEGAREALEERVRRGVKRAGAELPSDEERALASRLRRLALRERFGLPTLSLFAPEALAPHPDDDS